MQQKKCPFLSTVCSVMSVFICRRGPSYSEGNLVPLKCGSNGFGLVVRTGQGLYGVPMEPSWTRSNLRVRTALQVPRSLHPLAVLSVKPLVGRHPRNNNPSQRHVVEVWSNSNMHSFNNLSSALVARMFSC